MIIRLLLLAVWTTLGVQAAAKAAPKTTTTGTPYVVRADDSLASIASMVYGSPHYQLLLSAYNRLPEKAGLKPGQKLAVPELKTMLVKSGLSKQVEIDIDRLLAARYLYMQRENEMLRSLERTPKGQTATLPHALASDLKAVADDFAAAGAAIAKKSAYAESPVRVKQRLDSCAQNLRQLASGHNDAKLAASIHLLLAQTWVRLLMWARGEDG